MGKPAVAIVLTDDQRHELEGLVRRRQTSQGLARKIHAGSRSMITLRTKPSTSFR